MNKLIEMKELLDDYLENMNMLNEDGSVKKEAEPAKEETVEEKPTEETECEEEELSDKDAIVMIRKGK